MDQSKPKKPEQLAQMYDPERFREWGHQMIDLLADHHAASLAGTRPQTLPWVPPDEALAYWRSQAEDDTDPTTLFQRILDHSIHVHDPRYIGHQVGAPAPLGVLFGMLASYLNNGMAVYEMGITANCHEALIVEELCRRFGFPSETSGGILTSGGTLANLTALLSAREAMASRCQGKRPAIMVSEEAHYSIERAAKTIGWPPEAVVQVPSDDAFRLRPEHLEAQYQEALARGFQVIAVIGCACTTATGSYDDLDAIADFCERHELWFHVDGAHGAAAIFSATHATVLQGIHRADSVVLDFHKLLMTPTPATALLYKNNQDSFRTFQQESAYLLDLNEDWYNSGKRTFECTKYMISAKIYGLVHTYGWDAFGANVDTLFANARAFGAWLAEQPDFSLACPPQANILCFRYEQKNLPQEESNQQLAFVRQAMTNKGEYYIVQTTLRGKRYLRMAVMNPFTTLEHIKGLCGQLREYAVVWHKEHR